MGIPAAASRATDPWCHPLRASLRPLRDLSAAQGLWTRSMHLFQTKSVRRDSLCLAHFAKEPKHCQFDCPFMQPHKQLFLTKAPWKGEGQTRADLKTEKEKKYRSMLVLTAFLQWRIKIWSDKTLQNKFENNSEITLWNILKKSSWIPWEKVTFPHIWHILL